MPRAPLIPMSQAATDLGVCERQLRKLIKSGDVAAINIGTGERPSWRFDPSDIDSFISRRRRMQCPSEASTTTKSSAVTSTTSGFEVIDFEDRLRQRTVAKQNGEPKRSVPKRNPSRRRSQERRT